jgi:serine protease Do
MMRVRSSFSACRGALLAAVLCVSASAKDTAPVAASPALELARQLNQAFVEVADSVSKSVVVIKVKTKEDREGLELGGNPFLDQLPDEQRQQFERFFERFRSQPRRGQRPQPEATDAEGNPFYNGRGSGMVMREDGYILTNNHVVEDAEAILVVFKDGREVKAEVRGRDPESDLAVIQLSEKVSGLVPVKFADSDKVKVGEFAIAIGAPFDLEYSVTFGHVSAKGRQVEDMRTLSDQDFIQTDANINVGNSGGPLVNINGEVMGVNSMIRTSMGVGVGIGFAIPSNLAREIGDRLIDDGRFVRSWLGIGIADLREYRRFRDIDTKAKDGVVVRSIEPNGPAYGSDLKPADVITSVDGKPVATTQQLRSLISRKKAGTEVMLDVFRRDEKIRIKVKPDEKPSRDALAANRKPKSPKEAPGVMELGMTVKPLTKDSAKQFGVEMAEGVIVTEVQPGSLADRYEIKQGDIITDINHEPVRSPKEFQAEVSKAKGRVLVSFIRDGTPQFEVLKERSK